MEVIEEFAYEGKTIKIYYDPDPLNPRKDWDNGTVIAYWTTREVLGEEQISHTTKEEMIAEYEERGNPILAILPLYAFIHSGVTVSTNPFGDRWDSGQAGWVFVTKNTAEMMGFDTSDKKKLEEIIKSDVKIYDDYLNGRVYGYEISGMDEEVLESCWGFVGDLDYCIEEAKITAMEVEDPAHVRIAEELAGRITYASV